MSTLFPVDAPAMPLPGSDFLAAAAGLGDRQTVVGTVSVDGKKVPRLTEVGFKLEAMLMDILYGRGQFEMSLTVKSGQKENFALVAGHKWGRKEKANNFASDLRYPADLYPTTGPEPCDVMVIGKCLDPVDAQGCRHFKGKSGEQLLESLRKIGSFDHFDWYVTSVLKTVHLGDGSGALRAGWSKQQLHLLHQEIRLVQPKHILLLGSDAVKALLGPRAKLSDIAGHPFEYEFDMRKSDDDVAEPLRCQILACTHPGSVFHKPETEPQFEQELSRFVQLLQRGSGWLEEVVDHRVIENEDQLIELCEEIDRTTTTNIIAMDGEWQGDHPQNDNAYLRTIQLSWAENKAAVIKLRHAGGEESFGGGIPRCMEILTEFMRDKRACGHYFVADLEWFLHEGLDIRSRFAAPRDPAQAKYEGGLDTALMAHAVDETGDFSLTAQALAYTTAPRYDVALAEWKKDYCANNNIKISALEGYGDCPDEILFPYGAYDADVTYRLCMHYMRALDSDQYGNDCWYPFWVSQRAALACLEITCTGLVLDRDRVDELTLTYMDVCAELESNLRKWANWPDLNLNSVYHVRELLFGRRYNGKEHVKGQRPRLRPRGAKTLGVIPLTNTDKRPKRWEQVVEEEREDIDAPSTNRLTLGILKHQAKKLAVMRKGKKTTRNMSKPINLLRDYRFVSQVLKSALRRPEMHTNEAGRLVFDTDGDNLEYGSGLAGVVCSDGRVRTTIYQTKETGRWSSARPPLQNLGKRREVDYQRILGDRYRYPARSVLCAPPGWCLVEADYVGAELFIMAILAGDEQMIDHALRNQLPENDPNYYDIHSSIAKLAFGYDCPPTKAGLSAIGKSHMRIVAKSVVFGVAYGRGAKAIALAAQEEGVQVAEHEAQKIIDTIFEMYPGLVSLFEQCRWRVVASRDRPADLGPPPRWLRSPFGRYRRFPAPKEERQLGEFERQAQNFPIQGCVADAVSLAIAHLYDYREDARTQGIGPEELDYKICLQIHDAIVVMAPAAHVPRIVDEILPECMVQKVPIYPTTMDGEKTGTGPYRLGIDVEVSRSWGVKMNPDDCLEIGLDPKYAGWELRDKLYVKGDKLWLPGEGLVAADAA